MAVWQLEAEEDQHEVEYSVYSDTLASTQRLDFWYHAVYSREKEGVIRVLSE